MEHNGTTGISADSALLSRDQTIREIHDRVKNNLQTIASLLRLQARRLASPETKEALAQSVRRIRGLALVHESLAQGTGDTVPFADVVAGLVRMIGDGPVPSGRQLRVKVRGDIGNLSPEVATPLVSTLAELLDNAARHAFPAELPAATEPSVIVHLARKATEIVIDVWDNGVGLPAGFSPDDPTGLGLSIVHSLITGNLGGTVSMRSDGGTWVHLQMPFTPAA